ncbi:hypothetical protein SUGI_0935250 [Cryptomeria japonica]|nr:hypothetical protein SUGI_0935250 [Cryptomeria japonica]
MGDQTFHCHPELKSVTNAVMRTVIEDPSLGPVQGKPLSSLGVELKQVRSCVTENSLKAREWRNILNEYPERMLRRKRSRTVRVPNKRVHNFMMDTRVRIRNASPEVEGHPNNMPKPSATINGGKYNLRSGKRSNTTFKPSGYMLRSGKRSNNTFKPSGYMLRSRKPASLLTHKDWTLPAGSESWEKAKMTGRRSGIQQRPSTESHLSPSESHGFRSNISNKNHSASPTKGKGSRAFAKSPTFDSRQQTGGSNICEHLFSIHVIQLPDLEDIGSWLNVEDDSLPDVDNENFSSLPVPMDNLDEIFGDHMICLLCNKVFYVDFDAFPNI